MPDRHFATLVATLALLAVPAPALGQSAGDDQYQDPLAAPSEPRQSEEPQEQAPATSAPSAPAPAPDAAPAAASADTAAPGAAAEELPRTGLPVGLVGLAGAALAGAGVALRRRI